MVDRAEPAYRKLVPRISLMRTEERARVLVEAAFVLSAAEEKASDEKANESTTAIKNKGTSRSTNQLQENDGGGGGGSSGELSSNFYSYKYPLMSVSSHSFNKNLSSEIFMEERLLSIAKELEKRLQKSKISGKTITLKIKYSDFTLQTRSKTLPYFVNDKHIIVDVAKDLLYQERLKNSVRLLGISVHNLNNEEKTKTELPQKSVSVQLKFEF